MGGQGRSGVNYWWPVRLKWTKGGVRGSINLGPNNLIVDVLTGDVVNYGFTITNNGNSTFGPLTVSDSLPGATITCPSSGTNTIATLTAGSTETCDIDYALVQSDFDTNGGGDGDIDNTANVSYDAGEGSVSQNDSTSVPLPIVNSLAIDKDADATSQLGNVPAGATITYTYTVINSGNVTLSNIKIADSHNASGPVPTPENEVLFNDAVPLGDSSDATANNGIWDTLAPGDTVTFTGTYTVTQTDVETLQ